MKVHILLILTVLCCINAIQASAEWHYPNRDINEPFPHWGGICDGGMAQSPIDISPNATLKGEFDPFTFMNYDAKQTTVSMLNNGHTIKVYNFPINMTLWGGILEKVYVLEEIHFHWASEHTIKGQRYPLEAHFVHRNKDYANMDEAKTHSDGIAVIGVLFHLSHTSNVAIDKILDDLDKVKSHNDINKEIKLSADFIASEYFNNIHDYLSYEGSLTTPDCNEVVTWIVLLDTFPVTLKQIEQFEEVEYEESKNLKSNYRDIQQRNNRKIIYAIDSGRGNSASLLFTPHSLLISILCCAVLLLLNSFN